MRIRKVLLKWWCPDEHGVLSFWPFFSVDPFPNYCVGENEKTMNMNFPCHDVLTFCGRSRPLQASSPCRMNPWTGERPRAPSSFWWCVAQHWSFHWHFHLGYDANYIVRASISAVSPCLCDQTWEEKKGGSREKEGRFFTCNSNDIAFTVLAIAPIPWTDGRKGRRKTRAWWI